MTPDDSIKKRARKVVDAGSVTLAHLQESIETNEKLDALINKPDIEMPEPPEEMVVSNFPEVQKVEVINLPEEKDDTEQLALLKEISQELKKKEEYAYDIEIDATLKEQLRGEKGKDGVDGIDGLQGTPGKDGSPDTPDQVVDKINASQKKINTDRIFGLSDLIKNVANSISLPVTTMFVNGKRSKNLAFSGATVVTQGDTSTITITPGSGSVTVETPSGAIDETNVTFTVTSTPKWVVSDGVTYFDGAGYTLSGLTLTMDIAPTGFIRSIY